MQVDDYQAEITINDVVLPDWTKFVVSEKVNEAEKTFQITLNRPIDIGVGDTNLVTIKDGFKGDLFPLLEDKEIEAHAGSTLRKEIIGAGTKLSRKALAISRVYVNQTWLDQRSPGYVFRRLYNRTSGGIYQGGILYAMDPGAVPTKTEGVSDYRLMIPEMPPRDVKDHEFEIILQPGITYNDIARDIARICGMSIFINVPNLPVQKTLLVNAGETYWSIFPRLFSKWNPMMFVRTVAGTPTLFILDLLDSTSSPPYCHTYSFTESAFTLYEWNVQKRYQYVDHLVIRGPSAQYTYIDRTDTLRRRNYTPRDLPGATIVEQYEEKIEDEVQDQIYNLYNLVTLSQRPSRIVRTVTKKKDPSNPKNRVTIQENVKTYNVGDTLINEATTDYTYADFTIPLGSHMVEYIRVFVVGTGGFTETGASGNYQQLPTERWIKAKEVWINYLDYIGQTGAIDMDKVQYELCVTFKAKEKIGDTDYISYDYTWPIRDAIEMGEKIYEETEGTDTEGWHECWEMTRKETLRYDIGSMWHLRKTLTVVKMVPSRTVRTFVEDIPLPDPITVTHGVDRKWEYFKVGSSPLLYDGSVAPPIGDYHPKMEMYEPDVVDEPTAYKIAYRQFQKRHSADNTIAVIETTTRVPGLQLGGRIILPECTKKVLDWATKAYVDVTMDSKTYWIVGIEHITEYQGNVKASQRRIRVYDRVYLREYY